MDWGKGENSIIRKLVFWVKLCRNQYTPGQFIHQGLGLKGTGLGTPSMSSFGTHKLPFNFLLCSIITVMKCFHYLHPSPVRQGALSVSFNLCPILTEKPAHKILLTHGPTWKTQTHWALSLPLCTETACLLCRSCENLAIYISHLISHLILHKFTFTNSFNFYNNPIR